MPEGIGDRFQDETKYHPERMPGGSGARRPRPELYKTYPGSKTIELPNPWPAETTSLSEALRRRRSVRDFARKPISLKALSQLLAASGGIQREEGGYAFRLAPSAGALYPIETYLVANQVEGLPEGVYHYAVQDHRLEELRPGDFRQATAGAALGQGMCAQAPVVFVWTAIFERSRWKYRQRAYRYIYLDAGHIAQNLALMAVGLGLGTCQIGALFDDEVNQLIDVDGREESVIYMSVVGYPR